MSIVLGDSIESEKIVVAAPLSLIASSDDVMTEMEKVYQGINR